MQLKNNRSMKEPKEEAERIIEMYYDTLDWNTPKILAVRCAILHVEGIIEENKSIHSLVDIHGGSQKHRLLLPIVERLYHLKKVLQIIKDK
jgi:hypothetical protein